MNLSGKPDAGNLLVRFDEGDHGSPWSLLYREIMFQAFRGFKCMTGIEVKVGPDRIAFPSGCKIVNNRRERSRRIVPQGLGLRCRRLSPGLQPASFPGCGIVNYRRDRSRHSLPHGLGLRCWLHPGRWPASKLRYSASNSAFMISSSASWTSIARCSSSP
jgi:ribosomal protein L34